MSSAPDCAPTGGRGYLTLLPGLRRLWRDEHAVQLGVDPARAVVVELPDPHAARVLDLLDGSRTEQGVLRDAAALGVPRDVTGGLVAALRAANVVVTADTLVPAALPEPARRRLAAEAASIAMRQRIPDAALPDPVPATPPPAATASSAATGPGRPPAHPPRTGVTATAHGAAPEGDRACTAETGDHDPDARDGGLPPRAPGAAGPRDAAVTRAARRPSTPAEVLRRRAATSVQVTGASRLVVPICSALASAGVGHVDPAVVGRVRPGDSTVGGLLPADTDRPRGTAATEAVMRAAPHADTRALREGAAGFVVQVGQGIPAELAAYGYARRALPHLLIEERDDSILVGPLVTPGGSPCLRCLQ